MDRRLRRASLVAGPLAVLVSFGGIAVAAALAPWFDLTHALSDLGRAGRRSRLAFNLGLILSGLLGFGYLPALSTLARNRLHLAGVALAGVSVVGMAGVGVFPTPQPLHFPAALTLYLGITALFVVWGAGDYLAGRRREGLVVAAAAPVHLLAWVAWGRYAGGTAVSGLALPELVGAGLFAAWVGWTARRAA